MNIRDRVEYIVLTALHELIILINKGVECIRKKR